MELHYFPYNLEFKYPFKLSHTARTHTQNAYLLLEEGEHKAWGESVFIPYYGEDLTSFKNFLFAIDLPEHNFSLDELHEYIHSIITAYPNDLFSIAGLDIALHNLLSTRLEKSISALYNIFDNAPESSFTLGISDKGTMQKQIEENPDVAYFKLKINQEEIERIITDYMDLCTKPFVVDANQGFTDKELALSWAFKLEEYKAAYLEQPFNKNDYESHGWLTERSPIPIIADESFQTLADLDKVKGTFDGINVKLMKCGGIAAAVNILTIAPTLGLKTILGCMSESSVASNAAMEIAPLADWVDLDGPLLINNDLFSEDADLSDAERIEILKRERD